MLCTARTAATGKKKNEALLHLKSENVEQVFFTVTARLRPIFTRLLLFRSAILMAREQSTGDHEDRGKEAARRHSMLSNKLRPGPWDPWLQNVGPGWRLLQLVWTCPTALQWLRVHLPCHWSRTERRNRGPKALWKQISTCHAARCWRYEHLDMVVEIIAEWKRNYRLPLRNRSTFFEGTYLQEELVLQVAFTMDRHSAKLFFECPHIRFSSKWFCI